MVISVNPVSLVCRQSQSGFYPLCTFKPFFRHNLGLNFLDSNSVMVHPWSWLRGWKERESHNLAGFESRTSWLRGLWSAAMLQQSFLNLYNSIIIFSVQLQKNSFRKSMPTHLEDSDGNNADDDSIDSFMQRQNNFGYREQDDVPTRDVGPERLPNLFSQVGIWFL